MTTIGPDKAHTIRNRPMPMAPMTRAFRIVSSPAPLHVRETPHDLVFHERDQKYVRLTTHGKLRGILHQVRLISTLSAAPHCSHLCMLST